MNRTLAVTLALACSASASAQVSQSWLTVVPDPPGSNWSQSFAIVSLDDGGIAVAGSRDLGTGTSLVSDSFVARLDASGNVAWTAIETTAPRDRAVGIQLDPTDGSLRVITTTAWGTVPHLMRLLKYDAAGALVWGVPHVGTETGFEYAFLRVDPGGNSYVAFMARTSPLGQPENLDVVVESYDRDGVLRWSRTLGGAGLSRDEVSGTGLAPNGDLVVTGFTNGTTGPQSSTEMWIFAIDSAGQVRWSRTRAGPVPAFSVFGRPMIDRSGTIYVRGFSLGYPPGSQQELVAYDAAGNVLWARAPALGVGLVALDAAGSIYVTASTSTPASWLAKYARDGALLWETPWSNPLGTSVYVGHLLTDPSGDVTVVASVPLVNQGFDRTQLVLRHAPDGSLRWNHWIPSPAGAKYSVTDATVNDVGATTLCGTRDLMSTHLQVLVVRLDTQSNSVCIGDGISSPCPCGNTSANGVQAGCTNSSGSAARLSDAGIASLALDTLTLTSSGETPNAPTILVQGSVHATPLAFGDGLLCVGGSLRRLGTRSASGGNVTFPAPGDPSISARAATQGDLIAPGSMRAYQAYYRDLNPAFCASPAGATWNLSNGLLVRWGA